MQCMWCAALYGGTRAGHIRPAAGAFGGTKKPEVAGEYFGESVNLTR